MLSQVEADLPAVEEVAAEEGDLPVAAAVVLVRKGPGPNPTSVRAERSRSARPSIAA